MVGAVLVAVPGGLWVLTLQSTGTAATMMGDEAEQWTASELRGFTRQGWRLVNHLALREDDIDHVLIGPGGAYCIETKWSASWDTTYGRDRVRAAVAQASANARTLRLWSPWKKLDLDPRPLVVLWGPGLSTWPDADRGRLIDGVTVMIGPALKAKIAQAQGDDLTSIQIQEAWSAMEQHIARRDPTERAKHPLPTSVPELVARGGLAIGAAATAFLIIGQILTATRSIGWTCALALVLIAPAIALLRTRRARWATWGWVMGIALPTVALVVAEGIYRWL